MTKSSPSARRALLVDDEPGILLVLDHLLRREGWEVVKASSVGEAEGALSGFSPQLAVVDVYLEDGNGLDFVKAVRAREPEAGIIVISTEDTGSLAMKAISSGADYFVGKPIAPPAFLLTVTRVLELRDSRSQVGELRAQLDSAVEKRFTSEILTQSDAMAGVLSLIDRVGARDLSVLVTGESGTGKELVARAIHRRSSRAKGPFVELNCAALPENLVESELFGHEKGAFTGAVASRTGRLEEANQGTLFLDEIGEMPLEAQAKLLRAVQEKRFVPVGGSRMVHSDFRIVAATNRNMPEEVSAGRFREDLYYRLAVVAIRLPPLRERREDIRLLLGHFLRETGAEKLTFSTQAQDILSAYDWPGNIRELRNFAQAIPVFCDGDTADVEEIGACLGQRLESLPAPQRQALHPGAAGEKDAPITPVETLILRELHRALHLHKGSAGDAAKALGMGRSTIYRYIERERIDLNAYKQESED